MGEAGLFPRHDEVRFTVYGTPAPKGSTRAYAVRRGGVPTGAINTAPASNRLLEWDAAVRAAVAQEAQHRVGPIIGPVRVALVFWLHRPASEPKKRRTYPQRAPDLDKLARAVLDPLSGVLIEDDARVVGLLAEKDYSTAHPKDARPRCEVEVWAVEPTPDTGGT